MDVNDRINRINDRINRIDVNDRINRINDRIKKTHWTPNNTLLTHL